MSGENPIKLGSQGTRYKFGVASATNFANVNNNGNANNNSASNSNGVRPDYR